MDKVRLQGFAWIFLALGIPLVGALFGELNDDDYIPGWGEDFPDAPFYVECFAGLSFLVYSVFCVWVIFVRRALQMIIEGYDEYAVELQEQKEEEKMMRCDYCNVEHKVVNKGKHLKKCTTLEKEKLAKIEAKRVKDNDPNLMTKERKSELEEIAERVFPNARYFKYKGERMELTTDIGRFDYNSCNTRGIESIDKQMVEDATRGFNRRNNPIPKKKSPTVKSYSGICDQQKRNHSTCGSPTDSRCPSCSRYACGSCRGSRTFNGRRVCEACDRNLSGD